MRETGDKSRPGPRSEVEVSEAARHWHVILTLTGDPIEPLLLRSALLRLTEERPFLDSVRFSGDYVELQFWDEGDTMLDVASLALRLWDEHRESAGLPHWQVCGLEVVEKCLREDRTTGSRLATVPPSQTLRF